ncbi:MAG: trypsin-like peptidase domain-containing protein [Lachnospiraceae bacterium]|nr:trypsin-like peptidase domain-containing protein [Lachnospiraceae bacterium]
MNFESSRRSDNGKPKKGGKFLRKAAAVALAAVLFGGVAGSAMVGVQYAAQKAGIVASADEETQEAIKKVESTNTSSNNTSSGSTTNSPLGDVSSVVKKVLPSVVAITNTQIYEDYSQQYGMDPWSYFFWGGQNGGNSGNSNGNNQQEVEAGSGSGIIIGQNDKELLIVTNYHVIKDADSLTMTFADNSTAKASVKGTDSDNDLAVVAVALSDLKSETKKAIAVAEMDTSNNCEVGQGVIAIGNALGYGQSITVGYISALDREVKSSDGSSRSLLQTDAAINPGNSGGALINTEGKIIGINSAKYSDTDVEGMGFAIPIAKVHDIIDDLMNQKTKVEVTESKRGYLGIQAATVNDEAVQLYGMPEGVYVKEIMENGAASKSKLQQNDIITKIDGTTVSSQQELSDALKYYAVGDKVKLTVSRLNGNEYQTVEIEMTLGKKIG